MEDCYGTLIVTLQLTCVMAGGRIMEIDKPVSRTRCRKSEAMLMRDEHKRQTANGPISTNLYSYRFQPDAEWL